MGVNDFKFKIPYVKFPVELSKKKHFVHINE